MKITPDRRRDDCSLELRVLKKTWLLNLGLFFSVLGAQNMLEDATINFV